MLAYDLTPFAKRINFLKGEIDRLTNGAVDTVVFRLDGKDELIPARVAIKIMGTEVRQLEIEAIGILD